MTYLMVMLGLLVVWVLPGHAAWVQYDTTTLEILGTFDQQEDSRPTEGTALMPVGGTAPASDIVWPVPPTCRTGRPEWTLVRLPASLEVNPSFTFFRCHRVENWEQVQEIRDMLEDLEMEKYDGAVKITRTEVMENRLCPASDTTPECQSIRAGMETLRTTYPTKAQLNTSLTKIRALRKEARDVKTSMGWSERLSLDGGE